ncbi:MAG: hypothetical protein H0X28_07690 [Solirubrobacterales bacterium]|nr:hypothetical protein [Solirubrobacterales bacterium]
MKRTRIAAGASTLLLAGLGVFATPGFAQPAAHASSCKAAKESQGCRLTLGGFGELHSNVFVSFIPAHAPKGSATTFSVPSEAVCKTATGATLTIKTRQTPTVGGTLSFSGKATVLSGGSTEAVKSGKISVKIKISSAKKARLTGRVEAVLTDGSKCSKSFAANMTRILGG